MMLEQNRAGLSNKKKLLIILGILIIGIGILSWIFFDDVRGVISEIKGCSDFRESFSVQSACNLNENEVKVNVVRGADNINLVRLKFEFQPSNSLWKVDGTKCLDVRLNGNKYGNYCKLIEEEEESSYVLNLSLGLQKSVKVWAEDKEKVCRVEKVEILENCY